ncbi:MAG: hypothetical protein KHY73_12700 [Fusobacterium nucleatum]|nr:hypothetical protein [Fusobacterium nucleatum]
MKNKIKLEIDKAIKMDSIDVVKADKMIEKIESKINKSSIEDLFTDLKDRDESNYLKSIYVSLWSMILYDKNKTDFLLNQYKKEDEIVRLKFKEIFNKTKKKIEDLESENLLDEGDSPYPLLLEIEKRLEL